jgi:hypothetical protein
VEDPTEDKALGRRRLDVVKRKKKKDADVVKKRGPENGRRLIHYSFLAFLGGLQEDILVDHLLRRCQEVMESLPVFQEDIIRHRMVFPWGFQPLAVMARPPVALSDIALQHTVYLLAFQPPAARGMVVDTKVQIIPDYGPQHCLISCLFHFALSYL